jgi:hypothetical protein
MIEIAGMHFINVGVDGRRAIHELDADFDPFALRACVEAQQRMLVEAQLGEDAVEAWIGAVGHGRDCNGSAALPGLSKDG